MDFSHVCILGRLAIDPAEKKTSSGESIVRFSMAVNRYRGSGESRTAQTSFIDCTAFGKQGQTIAQYVKKGDPLFVSGRLHQERWETDQGKRSRLTVIVEQFQFIGGKSDQASKPQEAESQPDQPLLLSDDCPF